MAKTKTKDETEAPAEQQIAIELHNPATDPTKTAQERLDALTEQHRAMHAERMQKDDDARK